MTRAVTLALMDRALKAVAQSGLATVRVEIRPDGTVVFEKTETSTAKPLESKREVRL